VRVYGNLRLYEKSGRYQLDLFRIESSGLGDLQLQFEQLKEKLYAEGLFDPDYKKELPRFPQRIGIITSPTGAAIQDILSVAKHRSPSTEIILYGVKVQGEGASRQIAGALNIFNNYYAVDAIIVGRGGGSLEDLWSFNEENVARAIFNSNIPVVSAVGHEIDFTIADFVADIRAQTPSAAAELVFPDDEDLRMWLSEIQGRQRTKIQERISNMRSDILNFQMSYSFRRPKDILQGYILRIEELTQRLFIAGRNRLNNNRILVDNLLKQLESLNPYNVLNRGYSMVFKDKDIVASINTVDINDEISIKLKDGQIDSVVLRTKNE
jgi:exodeoxyribonuclease VII large subunit